MRERVVLTGLILVLSVAPGLRSQTIRDAATVAVTTSSPRLIGSAIISAEIENRGNVGITSLDLNYSLNGGAAITETLRGLSISGGALEDLQHGQQALFAAPGLYDLCVWVSDVNGLGADDDPANDEVCRPIVVLSQIPVHNVIFDHYTGAWCGWCPDGTVVAENVAASHPEAIVVSFHFADAMEIPDGFTVANTYALGFPTGAADHFKFPQESDVGLSRNLWVGRVAERKSMPAPVSAAIQAQSWDPATRQIEVEVRADFYGPHLGDIRLNAYVLEDQVVGVGTGYDQVNFLNSTVGHPYHLAGDPIVGFEHNDVLRAMLGGPWGLAGVVPGVVSDGESYAHLFSYTLPPGTDEEEVELVGLVQMYSGDPEERPILNSVKESLTTTGCTLLGGDSQALADDTVLASHTVEVCRTITVGPNYHVAGPSGLLTLRAGDAVILGDGVSVGVDGILIVEIDAALLP